MKRLDLACYGLLASAFVLAGLLVAQIQNHPSLLPQAKGDMVLNRQNITMLTTQTSPDEEALVVLESSTGTLLVYRLDLVKRRVEIAAPAQPLNPWFREADRTLNGAR